MMGWFYDDGKDIIEICRVAAYLNPALQRTPSAPLNLDVITKIKYR